VIGRVDVDHLGTRRCEQEIDRHNGLGRYGRAGVKIACPIVDFEVDHYPGRDGKYVRAVGVREACVWHACTFDEEARACARVIGHGPGENGEIARQAEDAVRGHAVRFEPRQAWAGKPWHTGAEVDQAICSHTEALDHPDLLAVDHCKFGNREQLAVDD
jgi:hypothetical protein